MLTIRVHMGVRRLESTTLEVPEMINVSRGPYSEVPAELDIIMTTGDTIIKARIDMIRMEIRMEIRLREMTQRREESH